MVIEVNPLTELTTSEKPDEITLSENGTSLELLQAIYRCATLPLPTRMRAAGMALQFEHPKLAVTTNLEGKDFASLLETRLQKLSEAKPPAIESKPTTDATLKPMIPDRRFRR
jgi:hypothetical protein